MEKTTDASGRDRLLDNMHRALNAVTPLPDEQWREFSQSLELTSVDKNQVLLSAGEIGSTSYFIVSGLVRFYYLSEEGQEYNKAFYTPNQIVGPLSSLIMGEPSRYSIQTLEDSELFVVPQPLYADFMHRYISWERLFSQCCRLMLIRNERREAELLLKTPKDRYLQFAHNFPDLLKRIPQYHIASYLGITHVAMSRNRAKWDLEL